jgi:hypothetical protein
MNEDPNGNEEELPQATGRPKHDRRGLKAQGRERREKLQTMINTKPRATRNDLLPTMELHTLAMADLKMRKQMMRRLDPGHVKRSRTASSRWASRVSKAEQGDEARSAHSANARCVRILHGYFALGLDRDRIIASDRGTASKSPKNTRPALSALSQHPPNVEGRTELYGLLMSMADWDSGRGLQGPQLGDGRIGAPRG